MLKGFKPIADAAAAATVEPLPPPIEYRPPAVRQADDPEGEKLAGVVADYKAMRKRIDELAKLLNDALVDIRSKDVALQQAEVAFKVEQTRSESYRTERDKALQDRADLLAIFGSIQSQLAGFQFPTRKLEESPPPPAEKESQEVAELRGLLTEVDGA